MNQSHFTFSIERKPYTLPLIFTRWANEWSVVLAEFPDAKLIHETS